MPSSRPPRARSADGSRRRIHYSVEFKRKVVKDALARPIGKRIRPTCSRYPTVEPCQLRKWIRALEADVNREAGGGWSSEDGDAEVTPDTSPTVTRRGSFAELMPLAAWTPPPGCEDPEYEKAAREQNEADAWTVLAKARWAATQAGLDDPVAKDLDAAASLFLSQATQAPLSPLGLSGPLNLPFTAPLGTWGVVEKTQELSHPAFPSWHPTKAGGKAATARPPSLEGSTGPFTQKKPAPSPTNPVARRALDIAAPLKMSRDISIDGEMMASAVQNDDELVDEWLLENAGELMPELLAM